MKSGFGPLAYDIDVHLFPSSFAPLTEPLSLDEALDHHYCARYTFQRDACDLNTINSLLLGNNIDLARNPIVKIYGKESGRKTRKEIFMPLAYGASFIDGKPKNERESLALSFLHNMSHASTGLLTPQNIVFEIPYQKNAAIVTLGENRISHITTYTEWYSEKYGFGPE